MFLWRRSASVSVLLLGFVLAGAAGPSRSLAAPAGTEIAPISKTLQDAILSLKSSDDAVRQKAYDLIADKGDARLIPILAAYRDGRLQNRDGTLIIYGDSVEMANKQKAFPILDALTGKPLTNPDGSPQYLVRRSIDLSAPGMMRLPPAKRSERTIIADLISTLSMLDPDPAIRLQSIRDTGERAAKAFPDPADVSKLQQLLDPCSDAMKKELAARPPAAEAAALQAALSTIQDVGSARASDLLAPAPDQAAIKKVISALNAAKATLPADSAATGPNAALRASIEQGLSAARDYRDRLETLQKNRDDLPKYATALRAQLAKNPAGPFTAALREAVAEMDAVLGDRPTRLAAISELGDIGTLRAQNILSKTVAAARRINDSGILAAAEPALRHANRYQARVQFAQQTFAGLSLGSILVLLALGLSIIFGLMDVINMAHGEFMMIGAFTTYVVSEWFKHHAPGLFDYYPLAAVPAAFLVSGAVGYLCESLIVRHLYGRPLETLLATFGLSLVLIQAARVIFGDTLSVTPPSWMQGGWEVVPDLILARDRLYIVFYCMICIAVVYLIVNYTKMGLLLRATTQNRQMAAALGVPTRRVDALTFAFGCGLAGLAGVAVPLYNKINPSIGQEYIVESFMVVVVGGVGTLGGAIWAGLGLGFLSKYLEPLLASIPTFASSSSVIGKVIVLLGIVFFLQWRPQGLFPPKGRLADA